MIGTMRIMPVGYRLTLTEHLFEQVDPGYQARWPNAWEAGRLVVAPQWRVGQDVVRRSLWLTLEYLLQHTDVEHFVGSCTHALSRLYRQIGFDLVSRDVQLPGTEKRYTLIHGTVPGVLEGLSPARLRPTAASAVTMVS